MQSNIVKSEIVESEMVEKLEPLVVQASIQFVIDSSGDTSIQVQSYMQDATDKIINTIEKHKHQKVIPVQKYASTAHAAAYIDVDTSFLSKRQGRDFKLGKHFFKPSGQSIVRWDIEALEEWMRADYNDDIDDELASLLERR